MSYCLNPNCPKPESLDSTEVCQTCGTKLLLGDRYRSVKLLGSGGFGRTFLAIDQLKPSKPSCVIKQFSPQGQGSNHDKAAELFQQEVIRLDELGIPKSPNCLPIINRKTSNTLFKNLLQVKI